MDNDILDLLKKFNIIYEKPYFMKDDVCVSIDGNIIDVIQSGILGFCCCGNPDDNLKYLHKILKKLNERNFDMNIDEIFVLYVLDEKGFTEHGSSIFCSWLEEKGINLLNLLNIVLKE